MTYPGLSFCVYMVEATVLYCHAPDWGSETSHDVAPLQRRRSPFDFGRQLVPAVTFGKQSAVLSVTSPDASSRSDVLREPPS